MSRLRVLILEDDEDIIDLIRSVLEPEMECCMASNGLEGLQQVELAEPDFAICDIMMPIMDGNDFIKRVRTKPAFEGMPVIFLSALSSADKIKEGYAHGAALYLTKPIDPARLKRNISLFVHDRGIEPRSRKHTIEDVHRLSRIPAEAMERTIAKAGLVPEPKAHPVAAPLAAPAKPIAKSATPTSAPFSPPPITNAQRAQQAMNREGSTERDRVRILIVEDDRDTMQMLRMGLGKEFDVLEAGDGITAIEHAVRYRPDLFLIDGMLPRMTGYQLAVMLKKNRDFFRSPIIFMSGKATQRDQQYVQKLGITQFLAKPFTVAALLQVLKPIVEAPGFAMKKDRPAYNQASLEQLQHFETNRPRHSSLEQIEKQGLENALKKQLH